MASSSLSDDASAFNQSSDSSNPFDYRLPKYLADLSDEFVLRLSQARALLAVAMEGFPQTSESDQYYYLTVVDDVIESALCAFEEIISVDRNAEAKKKK
jgi:hypothetical protein